MIALVQRVKKAKILINNSLFSQINNGLCIYIGIHEDDLENDIDNIVSKITKIRIFEAEGKKFEYSCENLKKNVEIMLVPQFTLCGKIKKGTRPSFTEAMRPEKAKKIFDMILKVFKNNGYKTVSGKFGAFMQVITENLGPVNFIYSTK